MATVFEYIISIKDKATEAAQKIEAAVGGINKVMDKAVAVSVSMQSRIVSSFAATAAKVRQTLTQLNSHVGAKIAEWRKSLLDDLPGAKLIRNPLMIATASIGMFWGTSLKAMDAGKEKMKLQVLTGSEQIGGALYEGLTKFATDTVFGDELYGYATQMLANGIKDSNVMPLMKTLGDISMGDANKLGQLSLAFSQIAGKGNLAGQELLQLINAGFNPLQVLSEKTGRSMGDLSDDMSKGKISVQDVWKAMEYATGPGGKFNGMLEKVASTPFGQLENLRGQLSQMFIQIGQVFLPIATKLMSWVSWIAENAGPYIKPLVVILAGLSAGLLIAAAAQWVLNAAIWANPITWIIAGIVALIGTIVYLVSAFDGWGNAWDNLMKGLKYTWYAFAGNFRLTWLEVVDKFMWGVEAIQKAWYKVKSLWDEDGANAGLAKLNKDAAQRAQEMASQKVVNAAYANIAKYSFGNVFGEKGLHKNGTISGTVNKIKDAVMPGADFSANGKGKAGDKATKSSRESVATGGTKNTTIHITIGKQVESLTVVSNNIKEGAAKIRDIIVDEMTRAAAMAGALAQ